MTAILSSISLLFIPGIFTIVIVYGLLRKAPVYDQFVSGAKDGLRTAVDILPFILAIFVAIEALSVSGAMEFLEGLLGPAFEFLGIPRELFSLILLRPVSGSGSLVLVSEVMETCGADSFVGRAASVMVGSCETVFYVLALYFGVTAVKRMRHSFAAGMIGYAAGIYGALFLCRWM
ncbi:MAG: spore maturation protein [Firmicutes bacterium]|nr:spore maturation protein [Bacillota bacterium]